MFKKYLDDAAEKLARRRQAMAVRQLLVGNPLLGSICGLAANLAALLICLSPAPFEYIILGVIVPIVIVTGEHLGKRFREPGGDAANSGLTRVFGTPWIPSQERRLEPWHFEPWRTATIVSLILLTSANSETTSINLALFIANTWITAPIVGAIAATGKSLCTKQMWSDLLRLGPIPT